MCVAEGHLLVVRLRDPVSGVEGIYPPGGAIEPGETAAEAARRETREETGLGVVVRPESERVERYPFVWAGVAYDVTTSFFAASLEGPFAHPPVVQDADYLLGASWVPVDEALAAMSVHPAIAHAVRAVLISATKSS